MVKRVFKNKRLIRNILILAGLVIVGFFLWRSFVWTRLLEGNTEATQEDRNKASAICTAKGEENGSFDVEACFVEETINQTRIRLAAAVAQPTTQGPTPAVAQPTTQGPTPAVAQPTTQGSATATCPPGTSIINKTYLDEKDSIMLIPEGKENCSDIGSNWEALYSMTGGPLRCKIKDWSASKAACNQHIPTWQNCANGQAQYDACINS